MPNTVAHCFVDDRLESYANFLCDEWMQSVSTKAEPSLLLDEIVIELLLTWRTTAYMASMAYADTKSIQAVGEGYMGTSSPDSSVITFAEIVLKKLSRKIPELGEDRRLRSQIVSELIAVTADIRDARASVKADIPVEPIWRSLFESSPFQMKVWSSQRVSYATLFNAYETFIVRCARVAWGKEVQKFRTTSNEFTQALRGSFANDLYATCWNADDVKRVRFVRHALTHTGGRETDDLKDVGHNIKLINGVLQIMPDDNRELIKLLQDCVERLIDEALQLPQFTS